MDKLGRLYWLHSLAWRNLASHRLRSLLTGTAISLGTGTVLAAVIAGQAAGRQAAETAAQRGMSNTLLVQAGLLMTGGLLLFAAGFIIFNAFGVSLAQRTRELGLLRAAGATRGQVRRLVLAEAALLGLAGAAGGIGLGWMLAWSVMQASGALHDTTLRVPWWGLVGAPAAGLMATLAGALQPAWRAGRLEPLAAIQARAEINPGQATGEAASRRLGGALLISSLAAAAVGGLAGRPAVSLALPAVLLVQAGLLLAAMLLLPALVSPVAAGCEPILARWLGAAGRLAAGNVGRHKLRAALTAGAMAAGLAAMVTNSGLMTAGLKGSLLRFGAMLREDAFIVSDVAESVRDGTLTVDNFFQVISAGDPRYDLSAAVIALQPLVNAGVIRVERCRFVPFPAELVALPGSPAVAVDTDVFLDIGDYEFFEGDSQTARGLIAQGRAILLQPIVAERLGVRAGDQVTADTSQEPMTLTVAGIGGSAWNMSVLPYEDAAALPGGPTHLGIVTRARDPAGVAVALDQVRQALAGLPGVGVFHYDNFFAPLVGMIDRLEALIDGLLSVAVLMSALGVVNSMAANTAERRREIGLLRAVGATQRQVRQAVVAEAVLLGLLAATVAAGLGLLMLLAFVLLVLPYGTMSIGVRPDRLTFEMVVLPALGDLGLASAVALIAGPLVAALAAYWPARAAARASIVEATRGE